MPISIPSDNRDYLSNFASNDISFVHGDPITNSPPYPTTDPAHIYFVYMRMNNAQGSSYDERLLVKHLFLPLGGRTREEAELYLLSRARDGIEDNTVLYDFDVIDFQDQPCYVTMIIDERNWHFHPDDNQPETPAVVFRRNKIVNGSDGKPYLAEFSPNYSFYNFSKGEIGPADRRRSVIRFTNYFRKDRWGTPEYRRLDLDDVNEQRKQNRYAIDVYVRMPYYSRGGGRPNGWLTVVFDPPTPPRGDL